jgi:propionyl-CoA carboxylase alpha chain
MGIKTVAVYSDVDARSKHVRTADESFYLGPAPSLQSYLDTKKVLEAIKTTGAQAVHPGYGFLSENHDFAEACEDNDVAFVGPGSYAISAMGDKITSKRIATEAGVNVIPGFQGLINNEDEAVKIAEEIGYPVMIKASAGGGGKGMRVAFNEQELREGYHLSQDEAKSSFNDDRMFVEKFIENPHHIEIQILADGQGNVVAFPERECSVQRRNQKVVEESPSCLINPETRRKMQEQAIQLALAVNYKSAGTVEMLCDEELNFYFLEMNTRLQVEHPITECVSKEDLVYHMIRVAQGHSLKDHFLEKVQNEQGHHVEVVDGGSQHHFFLSPAGHAIECRVYSEDPYKHFLPSIGTLVGYREPEANQPYTIPTHLTADQQQQQRMIRIDSGVQEGSEISIYYDPMISKLVTFTEKAGNSDTDDRVDCIELMEEALNTYYIQGVDHNLPFLQSIMRNEEFRGGIYSTKFIAKNYEESTLHDEPLTENEMQQATLLSAIQFFQKQQRLFSQGQSSSYYHDIVCMMGKEQQDGHHRFTIQPLDAQGSFEVTVNGNETVQVSNFAYDGYFIQAQVNGEQYAIQTNTNRPKNILINGKYQFMNAVYANEFDNYEHMIPPPEVDLSSFVVCPMPGTVLQLPILQKLEAGKTEVEEGETLVVIEAMKMQNLIKAPKRGRIKKVLVNEGDRCAVDALLMEFEEEET